MKFDLDYFKEIANEIFKTASPTGYTIEAIKLIQKLLLEMGYESKITKKGNPIWKDTYVYAYLLSGK